MNDNIDRLNHSFIFEFIIANAKDKDIYKNMGITGFPTLVVGETIYSGVDKIQAYLDSANSGPLSDANPRPRYNRRAGIEDYMHNELFKGVSFTDSGMIANQDDEYDSKKMSEVLMREANKSILERKQRNRHFIGKPIDGPVDLEHGDMLNDHIQVRQNNVHPQAIHSNAIPGGFDDQMGDAADNRFMRLAMQNVPTGEI